MPTLLRFSLAVCLLVGVYDRAYANDRLDHLSKLVKEYDLARDSFYKEAPGVEDASSAEQIKWYQANPLWSYLPKVLAIADSQPSDEAALKACHWILESGGTIGRNLLPVYRAEERAWQIVESHHSDDKQIATLCLQAAGYQSPAREVFLRSMASRSDLPDNAEAYALIALAEYMSQRYENAQSGGPATWDEPKTEWQIYFRGQIAPEWIAYSSDVDFRSARLESAQFFRQVLGQYAKTPFKLDAPNFRDLGTFGDKARKSLHALEHLYVGAPAPNFDARDLDGDALKLADYRGKVVLLSFWDTGCGPCLAAVPKLRDLVEKFQNRPFALVGICREADVARAHDVAEEHAMTWPSLFDDQPGRVTDLYNVQGFPSYFLIDAEGKIAAKKVPSATLGIEIERFVANAEEALNAAKDSKN